MDGCRQPTTKVRAGLASNRWDRWPDMKTIRGFRWWIVGLICLGTIINYLARNSLAVLAPVLQTKLSFTTQQYSYVVAAFQIGYTVMQSVCGFVLDFLGLKLGFTLFALAWSGVNLLHALATGWGSLAVFRGLLGLSEASAIPAGIKAISEWFPAKERSVAVGFFNAGTSLGALAAPFLVTWALLRWNWQAGFMVTGGLGFIFALLWWLFYRTPKTHWLVSDQERNYIFAGQQAQETEERKPPAVGKILSAARFWGIAIPRFLAEPAWQTFNFWIPLYFATERHVKLADIPLFVFLPFVAADLGGIFSGYLSPFLMKYFKLRLIPSRIGGVVLGALLMIGPGCVGLVASPYVAIALFCMGGFAHQMISALLNTLSADVFEPHEVATANGFSGTAAWTGGLTFTLVVGALATTIGYAPLFACLTLFDIIGAVVVIVLLRGAAKRSPI
jgi:MFS transporter, ACS family, hexuronate transporter